MTLNPFQTYANDKRADLRVVDNKRVNWQLRDSKRRGWPGSEILVHRV